MKVFDLLLIQFLLSRQAAEGAGHHGFGMSSYRNTLELMWLQDMSYSYKEHIPALAARFGDTVDELKWLFPHSRFGLGAFVDKALSENATASGDFCYDLRYKLTRYTDRLKTSFAAIATRSGGDWKESQLDALLYSAKMPETAWSQNVKTPNGYLIHRFAVVLTDAGYKEAGDADDLPPSSGNGMGNCAKEDYPTVDQVSLALAERDITPVFLVTPEVAGIYRELVHRLGDRGMVWPIKKDGRDLREALTAAIKAHMDIAEKDGASKAISRLFKVNDACFGRECCPEGTCILANEGLAHPHLRGTSRKALRASSTPKELLRKRSGKNRSHRNGLPKRPHH